MEATKTILQKLYSRIYKEMLYLENLDYDPSGESFKSLWVTNIENDILDECIQQVVENHEEDLPTFRLIKIDADNIPEGLSFHELPVIRSQVFYDPAEQAPKEEIEKHGYGILYIRHIPTENYEKFPRNFTYGISKHHTIDRYLLSPHWLIVCGIPKCDFQLDVAGLYSAIDKRYL